MEIAAFSSAGIKLVGKVSNSSVETGDLVCELSVGLFKLNTSGFAVLKSNLEIVAFNSAGVKLSGEITNSGVEMGNLVCKMSVGIFKLSASGFTG